MKLKDLKQVNELADERFKWMERKMVCESGSLTIKAQSSRGEHFGSDEVSDATRKLMVADCVARIASIELAMTNLGVEVPTNA